MLLSACLFVVVLVVVVVGGGHGMYGWCMARGGVGCGLGCGEWYGFVVVVGDSYSECSGDGSMSVLWFVVVRYGVSVVLVVLMVVIRIRVMV